MLGVRMVRGWLFLCGAVSIAAAVIFPARSIAADFDQDRLAPQQSSQERDWTLIVSPYVWAGSLKGNGSLAGFNTDVNIPFSEVFDHLDFAAMGNVELTNGQWGVYLDAEHVKTSQTENLFANELDLGVKTTWLAAGAFYRVYEQSLGGDTVFGKPRTLTFEPTVGVRWTKVEADVSFLGMGANKDANWTDPFVGLRVNADLTERWNLFAQADVGGFGAGSRLSVSAQAYLGYRTMALGRPAILRVGYRVLKQDYETDDFTGANKFRWDVTQHGPVAGFSIQF